MSSVHRKRRVTLQICNTLITHLFGAALVTGGTYRYVVAVGRKGGVLLSLLLRQLVLLVLLLLLALLVQP